MGGWGGGGGGGGGGDDGRATGENPYPSIAVAPIHLVAPVSTVPVSRGPSWVFFSLRRAKESETELGEAVSTSTDEHPLLPWRDTMQSNDCRHSNAGLDIRTCLGRLTGPIRWSAPRGRPLDPTSTFGHRILPRGVALESMGIASGALPCQRDGPLRYRLSRCGVPSSVLFVAHTVQQLVSGFIWEEGARTAVRPRGRLPYCHPPPGSF